MADLINKMEEEDKNKMEDKKIADKKVEEVKGKVAEAAKKELDKVSKEKKGDKKLEGVRDTKKKEDKKDAAKSKTNKPKRSEAVVNGNDVRISTKHAVAVCDFIRNKNVDDALKDLDEVSKMKRAVPMKGEIPHRKGKMMSGRYPLNAVKEFTRLVKGVRANAINHELELEKVKISCMANVASRPQRRFGSRRFKRSHVQIKLVPIEKAGKK
jgi:ribosomal protein L22|tara:strand:+ start:117 stop:752 length:636 start_codon:yes stop_codon:yes gene_type:complete